MRSPADAAARSLALCLTVLLAGCGLAGGGDRPAGLAAVAAAPGGPAADYPMVLGAPFAVEGELYTPADTLNYDAVGYATLDRQGGTGVTAAHKTLPLPSYVEITSLESGKTILARVERRGPMTGARLVALSLGAQSQLGVAEGAPVRVRRVNPPEVERAELRAGRPAPERMETPKSLVEVLRRKLPESGVASLRGAAAEAPTAAPSTAPARVAQPSSPSALQQTAPELAPGPARTSSAYPLPPLVGSAPVASTRPQRAPSPPVARATPTGAYVVQAAAFSSKANAEAAAGKLGGFVTPAGKFYRVRTGPYATRGQAEAALAKVRAAGYSDARVSTAG